MKKSRFTDSQIIAVLTQAEAGTPVPELGGAIGRTGESFQYLTPNRGEWGVPKLIGSTSNQVPHEH